MDEPRVKPDPKVFVATLSDIQSTDPVRAEAAEARAMRWQRRALALAVLGIVVLIVAVLAMPVLLLR